MRVLFVFFVSFVVSSLGACAPSTEIKPPEIAYGRDLCDACGMIIGDARFAAATLMTDGKSLKFDDAGEMLMYWTLASFIGVERVPAKS